MTQPANRYRRITIQGRSVYEHRYVWEQANGPIPKGFHVHHKDENPLNNDLTNLECVPHGTHNTIHHKRTPVPCAEDTCEKNASKRGYCSTHYVKHFRREKLNAYSREYHRRKRAARSPEQVAADREAHRLAERERNRKRKGITPDRYVPNRYVENRHQG